MSRELDRGRRLARRRWARIAFGFLVIFGAAVTLSLLLSPARREIAESLAAASGVIASVVTPLTLIVMAYLGASASEKIWGNGDNG